MLTDAVSSTMHESGHAMYEQGLPYAAFGTPCGNSVSLGIHESQSRMWENQVGRSESFWKFATPLLQKHFGDAVTGIDARAAYESANRVSPGFIRVEADEATYNMHVMIRFELERAMLTGDLSPADLPAAWNTAYRDYLGLEVPDDRRGCLQDVHWSMGAMGYFPTYTLGNLYCAQIFETACEKMPGMVNGFADGQFSGLLDWLRANIHVHGRRYSPGQLCERITGKPISADPLMRYLDGKFRPLYGI
jgi:carboxypeptidase Taq